MRGIAAVRRIAAVVAVLGATVAVFGCGEDEEPDPASGLIGVFTGRVGGTDALIGVTVGKENVVAWVCDGPKGIALQFSTPRLAEGFDVTLPIGYRLAGRISGEGVEGALGGPAGTNPFKADPAQDQAGVWTVSQTIDGEQRGRVWIVLNDGRQQGATVSATGVADAPRLDTTSGTAEGAQVARSNPAGGGGPGFQTGSQLGQFGGGLSGGGLGGGATGQFGQFGGGQVGGQRGGFGGGGKLGFGG